MKVTLTRPELMIASTVGMLRVLNAQKNNRVWKYGKDCSNAWTYDIEAAAAEMVIAKVCNVYWSGAVIEGRIDVPDVGPLQVRHTVIDSWSLILHPEDKDHEYFVLVTGFLGSYRIAGGLLCQDGKKDRFWKDPTGKNRHAFFVPQTELLPFDEIKERAFA